MFALLLLTACAVPAESKLTLKPGFKAVGDGTEVRTRDAGRRGDRQARLRGVEHAVAMYDRATGKLLAASEGKAEHLNSAFVWKGKVYCATRTTRRSRRRARFACYDPETNKLTVFHDFKDPPGSLVWNVHDGKNWWCCFAHYGTDNAKTVLIKMTDEFKEVERWTFPKAVVDDWDKMSASGGIWEVPSARILAAEGSEGFGDTLLVSHHHYKVLYRLKLPKDGKELELVEALECPFPGQGHRGRPEDRRARRHRPQREEGGVRFEVGRTAAVLSDQNVLRARADRFAVRFERQVVAVEAERLLDRFRGQFDSEHEIHPERLHRRPPRARASARAPTG